MRKSFSRISFFVLTALLLGGFPNFMAQEAFAARAYSSSITGAVGGDSTTLNNIVVTFDGTIYADLGVNGVPENKAGLFAVTGPLTVTTANVIASTDNTTCVADGALATVTLVLSGNLGTGETPTISFTNDGTVNSCDDDVDATNFVTQTPTDGIRPVFSSAQATSSTTVVVTLSENVQNEGVDTPGQWNVDGSVSGAHIATGISVPGTTQITLTVSGLQNGETIDVDYTAPGTGNDIIDGATASLNNLATFNNQPVTNNIAAPAPVTSSSGGGSGCDDCEAPTLGVDDRGTRLVSNGFTYNGHAVDVERFFTPYPLIQVNVGQANKAEFKIYENEGVDNIRHFTFAFGLDKNQVVSNSKAMIELDIDHEGTETVTITDPENALDNVRVETSIVNCQDDLRIDCLGITIHHTLRAPLDFNIVATDVWDSKRNAWQNTYNHGIEVVGESLNPAKEYDGINKGHIYHLTETSKTTAVDEFGNSWSFNYGLWNMDYIDSKNTPVTLVLKKIIPTDNGFAGADQFGTMYYLTQTSEITAVDMFDNNWSLESSLWTMDSIYSKIILDSTPMGGYTRANSEFSIYKYGQSILAENKLGEICSDCFDERYSEINNIFAYDFPLTE